MVTEPADAMSDEEWIREWQPAVLKAARDIVSYFRNTIARDVAAEAEGTIYKQRRKFNPQKGSKRTWCVSVLRNLVLDRLKKRKLDVRLAKTMTSFTGDNSQSPDEHQTTVEVVPLTAPDIQAIESWQPKRRIEFLLITRKWIAIAFDVWERWLEEASISTSFDPVEIDFSDEDIALEQIAAVLEIDVASLKKNLRRHRTRCQKLRLFRELFEN